jgi:GNAT superfamily N-acetyltransferase
MGIRRATIEDWQAIQSLLVQLDYKGAAGLASGKMERMLQDPDEVLLVYAGEGRILGFLSLHFIPQIALEGDFARISYFAVDEAARSKGVGRAMEEHCTELARERGCYLIEVHCHSRRLRAHDFYFRQGFSESPKYLIKKLD